MEDTDTWNEARFLLAVRTALQDFVGQSGEDMARAAATVMALPPPGTDG